MILGRGAPPAWIAMVFLLAPGSCHFLLPAAHILDVGRQKGRQGRLLVKSSRLSFSAFVKENLTSAGRPHRSVKIFSRIRPTSFERSR